MARSLKLHHWPNNYRPNFPETCWATCFWRRVRDWVILQHLAPSSSWACLLLVRCTSAAPRVSFAISLSIPFNGCCLSHAGNSARMCFYHADHLRWWIRRWKLILRVWTLWAALASISHIYSEHRKLNNDQWREGWAPLALWLLNPWKKNWAFWWSMSSFSVQPLIYPVLKT